ncbi:ABC transporter ATP-binding protein [Microbacterium sp. 4-7]|uniref:ABC transporter ATP-binding protein n=1 Tax=Microbacterium sp. 4-7 TaxID=1885327 RepID=UPI00164F500E|nr:ATP-binding cassette domain-containing protein [Microbacterium sp. 4-7]MBC6496689.1 multidrug ABC transporter ATP-binding protein [Microbacterium sp. 4-7]
MIELRNVSKRYGDKVAVNDISFALARGKVTGLLGPNGAGKSTTMRMIVGLDRQTEGSVTVDGVPFRESKAPMRTLGAMLDAHAVNRHRTARNHLQALAATNMIDGARVQQVLEQVGLASVADKRVGSFSLGMGQRLGIATAILGEPAALLLDEPVNGLDPEGVLWVRELMRSLADKGTTVLVSSHLMAEMALSADHLIVMGRGRVIADAPIDEVVDQFTRATVRLRSPEPDALLRAIRAEGGSAEASPDGDIAISGLPVERVGELAAASQTVLHELVSHHGSLEDAFLELTKDDVEYAPISTEAAA